MSTPTAIAPAPTAAAVHTTLAPSAFGSSTPTPAVLPTAVPPTVDDRLPLFTTHEATVAKIDGRNALVFSVPTRSSLLLRLVAPRNHTYEERDLRWLHLLQAIAAVPSYKVDTIAQLATQALQLLRSPKHKPRLEQALRGFVNVISNENTTLSFAQKAVVTLRLKEQAARFVREWVQDPIEGYVLRKDHVVGGMRLDDLVATPVGAGYLRGYRRDDCCCIVLYPWGHGFIHRKNVEPLDVAIDHERQKRRRNEYLVLEHQHLFEQVESLLESHVVESIAASSGASGHAGAGSEADSIDWEQYRKLLEELQQEHFDSGVLQQDLSFVRRLQALTQKLHKRQCGSQTDSAEDDEDSTTAHTISEEAATPTIKREGTESTEPMDLDQEEQKESDSMDYSGGRDDNKGDEAEGEKEVEKGEEGEEGDDPVDEGADSE